MSDVQKPANRFPWYKERLKWKYIQKLDEHKLSCNKWQFPLSSGDSDFRSGVPRKSAITRKKERNIVPVIGQHHENHNDATEPSLINKPPPCGTVYSRTGPTIHRHISRLLEAESSLQAHPLGLYPHLEESLSPQISEEVIRILDPSLAVSDEVLSHDGSVIMVDEDQNGNQTSLNNASGDESVDSTSTRNNIYQFPLKKSKEEELMEAQKLAEQNTISPEQERAVDNVMKDLVDWIVELRGSDTVDHGEGSDDSNTGYTDINEAKIKKLFASDYQRMPVLATPIHVTELLSNIPPDLRPSVLGSSQYYSTAIGSHKSTPKSVKGKYGAWYLDVGLWKYRAHDEPLQDPKEVDKFNDVARKAKNQMLDNALIDTHSASAFKDFVLSQKNSMELPKFLRNVGIPSNVTTGITRVKPLYR